MSNGSLNPIILCLGMPQYQINGEEFVEFQILAHVLEVTVLLFIYTAVILAFENSMPGQTHLATVSWNG